MIEIKEYEVEDEMVCHPAHYKLIPEKDVYAIDVIEAATKDLKGIEAVDTGKAIKYVLRWDKKGQPIRDIDKAIWYLTHLKSKLLLKNAIKE